MKSFIAGLIVLVGVTVFGNHYYQQQELLDEQTAYEALLTQTKEIIRASNIGIEMRITSVGFFAYDVYQAKGSGVVFNEDNDYYYAITNFHVVKAEAFGRITYQVFLPGIDIPINAELFAYEELYDLAVMRFSKAAYEIPLINIYSRLNTKMDKNEPVFIVGSPLELEGGVSFGTFSQMANISDVDFPVIHYQGQFYQGQSGGALTDIHGNLIGINTWGNPDTNNEGLAIPLFQIHQFLEDYEILPK